MTIPYILILITAVSAQCPADWLQHDESCYHFSRDTENWIDAMTYCQHVNSYLVEINDASENAFITSHTTSRSWIGANDLMKEGQWVWDSSATDLSQLYTNWGPGEPNAANTNENCAELIKGNGGTWNDNVCNHNYNYVCERSISDTGGVIVGK